MNRLDDTVARYDPLEAVEQIAEATQLDERTVALVLEGEADYLACMGFVEEGDLDDAERTLVLTMRGENADILEASEGEYDSGAAVLFIQRNRGIDKETIARVLEANYRYMDERGFLDDDWGEGDDDPEGTA